jgi:hypothetical protein
VPTWGRRMGLIRMTTSNEPSILSCFSLTASGFQPHPLCFIDANDHPPLRKMQKNSTALPAFSAVVEGGLGRLGSTQMTTVLYSTAVHCTPYAVIYILVYSKMGVRLCMCRKVMSPAWSCRPKIKRTTIG